MWFALVVGLLLLVLVLVFWIISLQARLRRSGLDEVSHDPPRLGHAPAGPTFVISPEEAKAGARKGFKDYGVWTRPGWTLLLNAPAVEQTPLLVRRLDVTDPARTYYFLVPVGPNDQTVVAAARVNGMSGEFMGCSAFVAKGDKPQWGSMIAACRTDADTRRMLTGHNVAVAGRSVPADSRAVGIHPTLVWKPCVESRSPYYPFRLVNVGGRPKYIRIDGKQFDELTDLQPTLDYSQREAAENPPSGRRD